MTATQKSQPRSRHDVQDATATAVIASKGRTATAATITATATARSCTTATARHTTDMARTSRHDHRDDVTTHAIAHNNDHARANITRHAKTQPNKRSNVAPCNKHPRGGVSPRRKKQGRLLSSADAECSLEHFWITRYLRSLHIFSGCNRFCTLHIVYNVPWIDVDGGRAQLGSASISGCYHSLRVA